MEILIWLTDAILGLSYWIYGNVDMTHGFRELLVRIPDEFLGKGLSSNE